MMVTTNSGGEAVSNPTAPTMITSYRPAKLVAMEALYEFNELRRQDSSGL
jgi:hypothetical protein